MSFLSPRLQLQTMLRVTQVPFSVFAKSDTEKTEQFYPKGDFKKKHFLNGFTKADKACVKAISQCVENIAIPLLTEQHLENMADNFPDKTQFYNTSDGKYITEIFELSKLVRTVVVIGGTLNHGVALCFSKDDTLLYIATRLVGLQNTHPSVSYTLPPANPVYSAVEADKNFPCSLVQLADATVDGRTGTLKKAIGTSSFSLLKQQPSQLLVLSNA